MVPLSEEEANVVCVNLGPRGRGGGGGGGIRGLDGKRPGFAKHKQNRKPSLRGSKETFVLRPKKLTNRAATFTIDAATCSVLANWGASKGALSTAETCRNHAGLACQSHEKICSMLAAAGSCGTKSYGRPELVPLVFVGRRRVPVYRMCLQSWSSQGTHVLGLTWIALRRGLEHPATPCEISRTSEDPRKSKGLLLTVHVVNWTKGDLQRFSSTRSQLLLVVCARQSFKYRGIYLFLQKEFDESKWD